MRMIDLTPEMALVEDLELYCACTGLPPLRCICKPPPQLLGSLPRTRTGTVLMTYSSSIGNQFLYGVAVVALKLLKLMVPSG